jgi:hypothetical protein
MAIALIRRAQYESTRLTAFETALKKARARSDYNWKLRCEIESKFSPIPHKSIVNDSLKMARQLLKEEYI